MANFMYLRGHVYLEGIVANCIYLGGGGTVAICIYLKWHSGKVYLSLRHSGKSHLSKEQYIEDHCIYLGGNN